MRKRLFRLMARAFLRPWVQVRAAVEVGEWPTGRILNSFGLRLLALSWMQMLLSSCGRRPGLDVFDRILPGIASLFFRGTHIDPVCRFCGSQTLSMSSERSEVKKTAWRSVARA